MDQPPKDDKELEKRALAEEFERVRREFFDFMTGSEQGENLRQVVAMWMHMTPAERQVQPSIEKLLAGIDPEQSKKVLELQDFLAQLHGCIVSFKVYESPQLIDYIPPIGGEDSLNSGQIYEIPEPAPEVFYVLGHDVASLEVSGRWMISLKLTPVPVGDEELGAKGSRNMSLAEIYNLRIITLPGEFPK